MSDTSSAILALLGGTAFRLVLGFAMDRIKDYQDHKFEMASLRVQNEMEEAQADRHVRVLKAQKDMGVTQIDVERDRSDGYYDMVNFQNAVDSVREPTGFKYLDMWNSAIRPALATFCIVIWGIYLYQKGWILGPWDLELIAATLGIFIGSRIASTGK